jgi:Cu/Ag efflux protein CusF
VNIAAIVSAAAAAIIMITISPAIAQPAPTATVTPAPTATVTKVDRLNRTIAVRRNETTGANTSGAAEEFKAQEGLSLEDVHAGDRVTFSTSEVNGVKTITKVQKQ